MANDEVSQPEPRESVGQKLKRAREQLGLSETDVANAQHLRTGVIQAIEAGEFKKIDSELFLKGYVRAYARMVGLGADEIISDLDEELEPLRAAKQEAVEANPLINIERRREKKRRVARGLFFTGILVLAGYLAFAFILPKTDFEFPSELFNASAPGDTEGALEDPETSAGPDSESTLEQQTLEPELTSPEGTGSAEESPATATVSEAGGAPELDSAAREQAAGGTAEQDERPLDDRVADTSSEVPVSDASDEASVEEPLLSESVADITESESVATETSTQQQAAVGDGEVSETMTQEPVVGEPGLESETDSAAPELTEAAPVQATEDSAGTTVSLEISFIGDCWIQVTDADGDRLVSALRRSGDRLEVSGTAPLSVVVGAVDAVSAIQFAGQPVDLSNFRVVNNRSEFTLSL
ncbi:DUF4115 domain-containing protein [Marinobacter salinisoli]|uniref:DUF4115 domain-containing protein n=1 Tax=Marinobacter salinisoli TaxID=2769486 RepID=A0ABX7MPG5_9GAMM|nr:RodZ domain-containing protein [Marinobacter salinisoli]QSP94088.1 DUF4115 domain-containing protein [Marinobacter salinisoli]